MLIMKWPEDGPTEALVAVTFENKKHYILEIKKSSNFWRLHATCRTRTMNTQV